jgi:hypothetical protein
MWIVFAALVGIGLFVRHKAILTTTIAGAALIIADARLETGERKVASPRSSQGT